jgi:hypothetical protein
MNCLCGAMHVRPGHVVLSAGVQQNDGKKKAVAIKKVLRWYLTSVRAVETTRREGASASPVSCAPAIVEWSEKGVWTCGARCTGRSADYENVDPRGRLASPPKCLLPLAPVHSLGNTYHITCTMCDLTERCRIRWFNSSMPTRLPPVRNTHAHLHSLELAWALGMRGKVFHVLVDVVFLGSSYGRRLLICMS